VNALQTISLEELRPNPNNPRKAFDDRALQELAKSIQELGLLQPLVVYPENGAHVVLCGDRRRRACELAGVTEVPCRVIEPPADRATAVQMALVENLQREDLAIAEEAPAIVELVEGGMKRAAVAKALGKSTSYIGQRYHLAIHPEVLEAFVKQGCTNLNAWAQVGAIETATIRARAIKEIASCGHRSPGYVINAIGIVRKFEKKLGEVDAETRLVASWCVDYKNPKAKIPACSTGPWEGKETCEHYVEVDYWTREFMGLKVTGGVCVNPEETCLLYKRDRETVVLEKLKLCRRGRLIKTGYDSRGQVSAASEKYGGKNCDKCKSRYKVPESFRYSGYRGHHFDQGYVYCIASDDACIKAKLKAFELAVKQPMKGGDYKKMSDDELRQMILRDLENADCTRCWKIRDCAAALKKRGYEVQLKHAVDLVKKEESG